jgi:hypothetical protein
MTMRARTIGLAVIAALVAILGLAMPAAAEPPKGTFQTVRNEWTNRCLDSAPDGRVYTLGCNGTSYQIFETHNEELESHATGRCIDPNWFGSVFATPCVVIWPRHFDFQRVADVPNYDRNYSGVFVLKNIENRSMCLDSNFQGNVYMATCNNGAYQRWVIIVTRP